MSRLPKGGIKLPYGSGGGSLPPLPLPATVADLTGTVLSDTAIQLAFTSDPNAASYQYRLNGGTALSLSGTKIVSALSGATSYDVEVRGVNSTGNALAWSNLITKVTLTPAFQIEQYVLMSDIDGDNPTFSSSGTISGLNESDDESALPLVWAVPERLKARAFICGAQDGNVAGVTQLLDTYEDCIPNIQTYMPAGVTVPTKADYLAITYQDSNQTTSGNQVTPTAGYRVSGDPQYALAKACADIVINIAKESWVVPGSTDRFKQLTVFILGAPTTWAQVLYEAVTLGACPDIQQRVTVIDVSKQNNIRDINSTRFWRGHDNGTPADGMLGYGPNGLSTVGPAGEAIIWQFGGPSGNSRQENAMNDSGATAKAHYLANIVPAGAMGARIDRIAYASDSKTDQAEYPRMADGVGYYFRLRQQTTGDFSPASGIITTGGGPTLRLYPNELLPDSNRSASIAVTKNLPNFYGDTTNSLNAADFRDFVSECMDRYKMPRPTTPRFTSLEIGTLSAGSVTSRAPVLLQAPQGIYHVTLAEGVTVYAWKSRWAQGIWGGSYHLSGGMTYLMGLVHRVGAGSWTTIGTHGATFASQAIPTFGDGLVHEIGFQVAATNAVGTTTTILSRGTLTASGADVTAPTFTSPSTYNQVEGVGFSQLVTCDETVTVTKVGGADTALFGISANTLTMAAKVYALPSDADANGTYVVTVRATDGAGNFTDQTITVTVTAAVDVTAPSFTSSATFSVAENTTAVGTVTCNETVTFANTGGLDSAKFTINSSTGALVFAGAPDYETPTDSDADNVYNVIITATDTAGNTQTQSINVTVTDVSEGSLAAETTAWIAAMTVAPDATRTGHLDTFIKALKSGAVSSTNILAKLDRLYLGAMHDAQAARVNAISATETLTVVGTPVFLADAGYESNLAGNLQDSFNPGNGGTYNWLLNDAGLGVGSDLATAAPSGGGRMLSAPTKNSLTPRTNGTNLLQTRSNTATSVTVANSNGKGLFMLNRLGSTGYARSLNNVEFAAATSASVTPVANEAFNWLSDGATGYATNDAHLTIAWAGGGLSVNQRTDIYNAYVAYMTAIGQSARL